MEIKNIKLKNFTVHETAEFTLPETGLVFVSGENGAGKSSIAEAVAYGLWGKTMRGTPTWAAELKTECSIETYSGIEVKRTRKGNSEKLKVSIGGEDFTKDTKTKTQEVLEQSCSSFNLWRKSHVFTRENSSYFACATDQERKKILETVLQLDKFDEALKKCKADLSEKEDLLRGIESKIYKLTVDIEAKESIKASLADTKAPKTPSMTQEQIDALNKDIEAEKDTYLSLQEEYVNREKEMAGLRVLLSSVREKITLLSGGSCDSCGQEIDHGYKRAKLEGLTQNQEEIVTRGRSLAEAQKDCQAKKAESEKRGKSLREDVSLAQRELDLYTRLSEAAQASQEKLASVEEAIKTAKAELAILTTEKDDADREVEALSVCKKVLGIKGVRSHIFAALLESVEGLANSWLSAIDAHFTIGLTSYTANKTGGIRDAIDIKVNGVGHNHGYKGCSSGEQRRINIALLLALGEVARGLIRGNGKEAGGTIFFDEAFAGLDKKGKELVTHSLKEISKERCVVIIEHEWSSLEDLVPTLNISLRRTK